MRFGLISLFPEMFYALNFGITGKAMKENLLTISTWNPRDFTLDKHQSVDDRPYGGGPGMVMMVEPLEAAIKRAKEAYPKAKVIYLSPQGKPFCQKQAERILSENELILIAGRYEGIDERVIASLVDEEWSIGDYILTGGELAAMVVIDSVARLIPGALGDPHSVQEDSLTIGLLKYPQYTRPENHSGSLVPPILLSGHHKEIKQWRLKQSLGRTWLKRPDLLEKKPLTTEESKLLNEFIGEWMQNNPRKSD